MFNFTNHRQLQPTGQEFPPPRYILGKLAGIKSENEFELLLGMQSLHSELLYQRLGSFLGPRSSLSRDRHNWKRNYTSKAFYDMASEFFEVDEIFCGR